jgi:hypothetical protein
VERLVGICETPFYRRYRKWLARNAAGLRPAPAEILER